VNKIAYVVEIDFFEPENDRSREITVECQ
jgi:hypothetical protein